MKFTYADLLLNVDGFIQDELKIFFGANKFNELQKRAMTCKLFSDLMKTRNIQIFGPDHVKAMMQEGKQYGK